MRPLGDTDARRPWGVALTIAALTLGLAGCEMLGLDSGGGPGAGGQQGDGPDRPSGSSGGSSDDAGSGPTAAATPDGGGTEESSSSSGSLGVSDDETGSPGNPFKQNENFNQEDEDQEESQKPRKNVGPLKRAPLEEYRLVGIISGVAVPKAMFIAPDGKGHLVKEGQAIGSEGGTVDDIRDNTVEIRVPREGGGDKTIRLELRKREISGGDDSELSPREQETLNDLMESEEGREALRKSLKDKKSSSGNGANDRDRRGSDERAPNRNEGRRAPAGENP